MKCGLSHLIGENGGRWEVQPETTPLLTLRVPEPGKPEICITRNGICLATGVTRDQLRLLNFQAAKILNEWPEEK